MGAHNQRKCKAVRLGCLAAHGEQKDESGQQTYMAKGKRRVHSYEETSFPAKTKR